MTDPAIQIRNLSFSYGSQGVLRDVNLEVPAGSIFGFLGRNGSGKTTTIKVLLGLLRPSGGSCRVGGLDPAADPLEVRRVIGYMAEDQRMYGWMRVEEIVRWVASFYPEWDMAFTSRMLDLLELPRRAKVKALSKGLNSRLALLLALGHKPKVVILDDPTLGLDPISRKEFLRQVIGLLQSNNATVFFSSHLLYEIEPVADHVAILDQGQIVKAGPTEALREQVRRFVFVPRGEVNWERLGQVLDVSRAGEAVSLTVDRCDEAQRQAIAAASRNGVQEQPLNLDEIFEAYVIGNRGRNVASRRSLDAAWEASHA